MGIQEGKEHADHIFIEKVYDKLLRERGIVKIHDKELDTTYFRKYNVDMKQRGNNLVP